MGGGVPPARPQCASGTEGEGKPALIPYAAKGLPVISAGLALRMVGRPRATRLPSSCQRRGCRSQPSRPPPPFWPQWHRAANRRITRYRVRIEHLNGSIKRCCRIVHET
jgi:hypothetical protein